MKILFSLLFFCCAMMAQYTQILGTDYPANSLPQLNSKPSVRTGTSLPGTCTAALDFFLNTSNSKWYVCTALNTWTENVDVGQNYANPSWLTSLAWGKLTGVPSTFAPSAHTHVAADTTSGIFNVSLIPDLDASKITTGTFPLARIAQGGATTGQALVWSGSAWAPATAAGGYATIQNNGTPVTQANTLNISSTQGITTSCATAAGVTTCTFARDTAIIPTRDAIQTSTDRYLTSTGTGSPVTAYTGTVTGNCPATYATGLDFIWLVNAANAANATLNVCTLGSRKIYANDGTTQVTAGQLPQNTIARITYDATLDGGTGGFRLTNASAASGSFASIRLPFVQCVGTLSGPSLWNPGNPAAFNVECGYVGLEAAQLLASADTSGTLANYARIMVRVPSNWNGTSAPTLTMSVFDGWNNSNGQTFIARAQMACLSTITPTFAADVNSNTVTFANSSTLYNLTFSGLSTSGCSPGSPAMIRLGRSTTSSGTGAVTGLQPIVSNAVITWAVQ